MSESNAKTAQDVYEIICGLSADEREELSAMLEHNKSDGWVSPEIKQSWLKEIDRREQLHRQGRNPNMSWEEVREKVLSRLDSLK